MKTFLSAILIFLASFGFAAELVQLDKLTTEIKAKESSASDENSEEGKKQKDADEKMSIIAEAHFISFAHSPIRSFYNIIFTEGFVSSPFNPPDNSKHFTSGS